MKMRSALDHGQRYQSAVTGNNLDRSLIKSFRLLKKIKDPKFEIDRLEFYSLSLFIGIRDFQVLVTDNENRRVLLLEDFVFDPTLDDAMKYEVLQFIFEDHHLLLANFWKSINVIIKNRNFSFVPYALYDETCNGKYLKLNAVLDTHTDDVMLTYHRRLDMVNVFSVPTNLRKMLNSIYPGRNIIFQHQGSCLVNGAIQNKKSGNKEFTIYIDRFGLHVLIVKDKKLIFYNQYLIHQFGEYQKYIKLAATEFDFDLEHDVIFMYGFLGKSTPHFVELKKFLPHLTLGSRPDHLDFGYVFDELLEHQYFDVFSSESIRI
jgi:hypothetical protein